jgi:hypothetical protein
VIVQVLDDGTIRFVQLNGECFDSRMHPSGDWRQLPAIIEGAGIHIRRQLRRSGMAGR